MKTRALHALAFVAFGLVCAVAALPFTKTIPNFLVPDDGFFYAQIAFNLSQLGRSTFDGIHTTSGYHLPWGFTLAAVSFVVGLFTKAKTAHLFAHLAVSFTLIGWTTLHFFRSWAARAAVFVLFIAHFSLTEMALAIPLLLALLRESTERRRSAPSFEPALAFVLSIVRIDLACVSLYLAVTSPERRRGFRLALATFAGIAVQLAWMQLMFGHFFSVAAELKTSGAFRLIGPHLSNNVFASTFAFLAYTAQALLGALSIKLRPTRNTVRLVFASLLFLGVHLALNIVRPWYLTPGWVLLAFVLEQSSDASCIVGRWRSVPTVAFTLLTATFVVRSTRVEIFYREDQRAASAAVADLRRLVPPGTALFTFDNPGYLGFFSGLRVVDGDGLVNDYSYARRLRAHQLTGYLDEENICWVVTDFAGAHPQLRIGGLVVDTPEMTLLAEHRRGHLADFLLYRLNAARCSPTQPAPLE